MKKITHKTKNALLSLITVALSLGLFLPNKVFAVSKTPCHAVGPYNICIPNTGILDTKIISDITLQQLLIVGAILILGVILIVNGRFLKKLVR